MVLCVERGLVMVFQVLVPNKSQRPSGTEAIALFMTRKLYMKQPGYGNVMFSAQKASSSVHPDPVSLAALT